MSEFLDVLHGIENRTIAEERILPAPRRISTLSTALSDAGNSTAKALSAYQQFCLEAPWTPSHSAPLSAVEFSKKLMAARGSRVALHALRRHIAWRLHPDRHANGALASEVTLAQCNDAIDTALVYCKATYPE
ncbi:hypothetical protein ACNHKD_16740 [Methylocystis sp. JAN1]|uniref:hypothetical protein n=1 Tax=Methylocystis sp. JAN1 TaxID=3397211 RepID=UPI003FA2BE00